MARSGVAQGRPAKRDGLTRRGKELANSQPSPNTSAATAITSLSTRHPASPPPPPPSPVLRRLQPLHLPTRLACLAACTLAAALAAAAAASNSIATASATAGNPIAATSNSSAFLASPSAPQPSPASASASPLPTELAPTVMVVGSFDWLPYQQAPPFVSSRCTDMVVRSTPVGGSWANYVPTHYWRGAPGQPVAEYCYMDGDQVCQRFGPAAVKSFRSGMEMCFRVAISAGFGISLVPHLDDAGSGGQWRNGLVFAPKRQYGGMSYQEVMLDPLADALAAAIADAGRPVPVRFALQGEMSATVLRFPAEYAQLIDEMRGRLLAGMWRRGASGAEVEAQRAVTKVGVSFNFNRLMSTNRGDEDGGGLLSSNILGLLGGGNNIRVPGGAGGGLQRLLGRGLRADDNGIDAPALKGLFEKMDFLGVSAYAPLPPTFEPQELQASMFTFYKEMRREVGVDVQAVVERRNREAAVGAGAGVELHYSEFGLGGGSFSGVAPSVSTVQAARSPYFGMPTTYQLVNDPWNNPMMRDFMRSYYQRALTWLEGGGGPTVFVSHCFIWGMGSWDVLGIYPESTTGQGSYRDGRVAELVAAHNRRAKYMAAAAAAQQPGPVSKK